VKLASVLATKGPRVVTISGTDTIRSAVARLVQHNIGALVVVDAAGKPEGIVSERDIIRRLDAGDEIQALPITSVMTRDVVFGTPQDDVDAVLATMTARHFRHLPVLENGDLIGVVSIGDVVKAQLNAYAGHIDTLQTQLMSS
jgi:CBS domain-containing protein